LKEADIYVCPLRIGTGIKNKVIEAMAMGIPIVSTPVGIDGIGGQKNVHYIVASRPEKFAKSVIYFLKNLECKKQFAYKAQQFVCQKFSSDKIGQQINSTINKILGSNNLNNP